jgi:hypothetical protein
VLFDSEEPGSAPSLALPYFNADLVQKIVETRPEWFDATAKSLRLAREQRESAQEQVASGSDKQNVG